MEKQLDQLSPTQRALLQIRELRAQLDAYQHRQSEPIAIVGMGCRFPGGANSPDAFWTLIEEGRDAISDVPRERWDVDAYYDPNPDAPGKMSTRWGGFVADVDRFDPEFFGIADREASTLDPQQRMLLEVCWEALEHAGRPPHQLMGTRTGVYVGIGSFDYVQMQLQGGRPEDIDAYLATGGCHSVASGRLSYALGLQGPSVSIDTACSSSLVAVHMACRSLRDRESDMALAGGVNAILAPELLINFSKAHMMAADGRCKVFDARADGFVRAEGCGIVVLQRLSDAVAQRARILGVIRGSAVNQDGRSSSLTAPNGPSQQAVIRAALENAGLKPADVHYVEAHGTGTALGDPIEVAALASGYGDRPHDSPLRIGSVKTNIGHAEAAAGIAGLIKAVMAMQHGTIPPHLHLSTPNPLIAWNEHAIVVPVTAEAWPRGGRPRAAGVSSFGFSGTNAHVILEEAPLETAVTAVPVERPLHVVTVSGRSEAALREAAGRYADLLDRAGAPALADVAYTANAGRSHQSHRAAVVAGASAEAAATLRALSAGQPHDAVVGHVDVVEPEVVFLFAGQGSEYAGMGRQLYDAQPTFRAALDRCDELLRPHLDRSILSVMFGGGADARLLEQTAYTQPALFALEYSLSEMWKAWGVRPVMAIGHSLGEDVAACVAGVLALPDALALIAARGRLMQDLPPHGGMTAVFADEAAVRASMRQHASLSLAAVNGPGHFTVSGERDAVRAFAADIERQGGRTKALPSAHAFHSALMDPMLDAYERAVGAVAFSEPAFGIVSTVTGNVVAGAELARPGYWRRHVRDTVQFAPGIRALHESGHRVFLEIGPNSTLTSMGRNCVSDDGTLWLNSLKKGDDWRRLLDSVAALHARGVAIDWEAFDHDYRRRRVTLPTYPFKRGRYWFAAPASAAPAAPAASDLFATVTRQAVAQAEQAPLDLALGTYPAKWAALDALSLGFMLAALQERGAFRTAGERRTAAEVMTACGIAPDSQKLVGRWLEMLAAAGLLQREAAGAVYVATGVQGAERVDAARVQCAAACADIQFFVAYVERCGGLLASVITGRVGAVETLFAGGSSTIADQIYTEWAMSRYFNAIVRAAVEASVRELAATREVRLLEVGGGTGATSATLLPALAAARVRYVFTDVSEYFLAGAKRRFADVRSMQYQVLDIEREPAEQGFLPGSFDVIVAANVLHATRRLDETIAHVRSLLAPGGLLVLYEVTDPPAWLDITFGLFEGWQRFDDEIRAGTPTVSQDTWATLLTAGGFERVAAVPPAGSPAEVLRAHVIVAQAPGELSARAAEAAAAPDALAAAAPAASHQAEAHALLAELAGLAAAQRRDLLVEFVRGHVMTVLRRPATEVVSRRERLMDLGVDSLMAVELREAVGAGLPLSMPLPATVVFDYPSIEAIAGFLDAHLPGSAPADAPPAGEAAPAAVSAREAEIRDLSDDEIEQQLLKTLDAL